MEGRKRRNKHLVSADWKGGRKTEEEEEEEQETLFAPLVFPHSSPGKKERGKGGTWLTRLSLNFRPSVTPPPSF